MIIERKSNIKYYCPDMQELIDVLVSQYGYIKDSSDDHHIVGRVRKARSIIVIYTNGTVLLQGADTQSAHNALINIIAEVPF